MLRMDSPMHLARTRSVVMVAATMLLLLSAAPNSPFPLVGVASFSVSSPTRITMVEDWSRMARTNRVHAPILSRKRLLVLLQGTADENDSSNNNCNNNSDGSNIENPPALLQETNSLPPSETVSETQPLSSLDSGYEKDSETELSVAGILRALGKLKETIYAVLRQILVDIVAIVRRSATKARDWAVEDEAGQLVSSALALVGFFALVAAFAAWNISVLSGGKSVWAGPTNGITVPVVRGLPPDAGKTTSVTFQKPRWKLPKIQTSYSSSQSSVDLAESIPAGNTAKDFTKP